MSNYTNRNKSYLLNSRTASSPHADLHYVAVAAPHAERGETRRGGAKRRHNTSSSGGGYRGNNNGGHSGHYSSDYITSKKPKMGDSCYQGGEESVWRRDQNLLRQCASHQQQQQQTNGKQINNHQHRHTQHHHRRDMNNNRVNAASSGQREVFNSLLNLITFNQIESDIFKRDDSVREEKSLFVSQNECSTTEVKEKEVEKAVDALGSSNIGYNLSKLATPSFNYSFIVPVAIDWLQKHGSQQTSLEKLADPRISFYLQKIDTEGRFGQLFQAAQPPADASSSLRRRHSDLECALLYRYKNTDANLKLEDLILPGRGSKKSKS